MGPVVLNRSTGEPRVVGELVMFRDDDDGSGCDAENCAVALSRRGDAGDAPARAVCAGSLTSPAGALRLDLSFLPGLEDICRT